MKTVIALSFLCVLVLSLVYADNPESGENCVKVTPAFCLTCDEIEFTDNKQNLTMSCHVNLTDGNNIDTCEFKKKTPQGGAKSVINNSYVKQGINACDLNMPLYELDEEGEYTFVGMSNVDGFEPTFEKQVTLKRPSQPPVLSVIVEGANGTKLEKTFNSSTATEICVDPGDQVTFTCNVSGGNPPVTDYIISCLRDSRCLNKANRSEPLVLTNLTSQHNDLECFCEAFYVKDWYINNRSTEVTLKVKDNSSSDPQVSSTSSGDKHTVNFLLIIIVTSSVVGALAIAVIIGVIVFKVKGKRQGQMEASTQDGPTANQTAGFSQDWRNDRTLVMVDNSALYGQFTQQLKAAIKRPDETT